MLSCCQPTGSKARTQKDCCLNTICCKFTMLGALFMSVSELKVTVATYCIGNMVYRFSFSCSKVSDPRSLPEVSPLSCSPLARYVLGLAPLQSSEAWLLPLPLWLEQHSDEQGICPLLHACTNGASGVMAAYTGKCKGNLPLLLSVCNETCGGRLLCFDRCLTSVGRNCGSGRSGLPER